MSLPYLPDLIFGSIFRSGFISLKDELYCLGSTLDFSPHILPLTINKPQFRMSENIFLFVPNLIGYARIVLALISFYFMPTNHIVAFWCYGWSAFLDAFDGYAARYYNQSTKFGSLLDQLTDRCGTMCLLVTLAYLYPKYMFLFQVSMTIDIASHWIHTQVYLMLGKTSHKDVSGNPILQVYYTNKPVLFLMCVGNELFYTSLYMAYFTTGFTIPIIKMGMWRFLVITMLPVAVVKSLLALLQLQVACVNVGRLDEIDRQQTIKKSS